MQTPFVFSHDRHRRMNWRNIDSTDIGEIIQVTHIQGDLRPLNSIIEDLSSVNLENDGFINTNPEVFKALKVMQVGTQYLKHNRDHLKSWCQSSFDSAAHEEKQRKVLTEALSKQKRKIRRLQKEIDELDSRGRQYDLIGDSLKSQGAPLDYSSIQKAKSGGKEPSYLARLKEGFQHEDELKDSDFELSASLADRKPLAESKPTRLQSSVIHETLEPEEDMRLSRFNNPGTGVSGWTETR